MILNVVFVTNIVVTHQIGTWDVFCQNKNVNFVYLATSELDEERKKMKYKELEREYIVKSNSLSSSELETLFKTANIVIFGCSDDKRVFKYLKYVKTIYFMSEHLSKKGSFFEKILNFFHFLKINFITKNAEKYLLSNSSFAKYDFLRHGFKKDHIFKFGYFPQLTTIEDSEIMKKNKYQICWCGRLLDWKRPCLSLKGLLKLLEINPNYHLTIIGEGSEKSSLVDFCKNNNLIGNVEFVDFVENEKVIDLFKKSSLFLFTSNHSEGWGVVLNEAMSQGCFCIASSDAGATNFLIQNRKNGLVFSNEDSFYSSLFEYDSMPLDGINKIQLSAVSSIKDYWNNEEAAKKLLSQLQSNGAITAPVFGPMSKDV